MTGSELRRIRLRMNRTQKILAQQLEVDAGTVSRWETGKLPIDQRTALAVLRLRDEYEATKRARLK